MPTSQEPTDDSVISEDLAITRLAQVYLDPQSTAARIRRSAGQRSDRAQQLIDEANQNPDLAARLLQDPLGVLQRAGAVACGDAITLELTLPPTLMDLYWWIPSLTWEPPEFEWHTITISEGVTYTFGRMRGGIRYTPRLIVIPDPTPNAT